MKQLLSALLLIVLCLGASAQLRVASYNMRYDNPGDSGNLWKDRIGPLSEQIRYHDFDLIGTQEGLSHQLADIQKALPHYGYYGLGQDDGKQAGQHSAIFYKKDRFEVLRHGDFWLSQTPDQRSKGWDATCCYRISSWVQLRDLKTSHTFYVFNTHFDHQGYEARRQSSHLMLQRIRAIAGEAPVILTGDFNGGHGTQWYQTLAQSTLLSDTYRLAAHPYAISGSFNGFGITLKSREIIDHIFVTRHFKVGRWGILTDSYGGKFPSDHFPIVADLQWN